jgi:hypothetical protein
MSDPVAIRQGVRPETDFGRELLDFCASKIASFTEEYETPPTQIALVLSGESDNKRYSDGHSWDASEKRTKLETCSAAAAILLKRAME